MDSATGKGPAVSIDPSRGNCTAEAALVAVAATLYLLFFATLLQRVGDEGPLLHGAALTAGGHVPYRDFFDLTGPMSFAWLALWFRVLGTSFLVARIQLVATAAFTGATVYVLVRHAYGRRVAAVGALTCVVLGVPYWTATSHHWDSNAFWIAAAGCAMAALATGSRRWLVVGGFCAGITSGFILHKGLAALLIVLFAGLLAGTSPHARNREVAKRWLAAVAGFVTCWVGVLMVFAANGALLEVWDALVLFPLGQYHGVNAVPYAFGLELVSWQRWIPGMSPVVGRVPARACALVLDLPLLAVVALPALSAMLVVKWWRGGLPRLSSQRLACAGGALLWLSELHRPDVMHLLYGAPLLLPCVIGEAERLSRDRGRRWGLAVTRALGVSCVALGLWNASMAFSAGQIQETRRGNVRLFARDPALEYLLRHTVRGEPAFVYPYYSMYYFLADIENATRFDLLVYGYNRRSDFEEAVADLARTRPRLVLWDTNVEGVNLRKWLPGYEPPPFSERVVERYLSSHYDTVEVLNGFRVMRRRDARTP